MDLKVVADYEALAEAGADLIDEVVQAKPDANIVLATGDTPMGLYRIVANRIGQKKMDVSKIRVFQLDGYLSIQATDNRSLEGWLRRSVIEPWNIAEERFVRLPEDAPDPNAVCRAFSETVSSVGGFDLAILGLGPNGHLGFNEPPSTEFSPTRVVRLTEESLDSNGRYWGGRDLVPREAITAGMDILLQAKRVLLLVSGERKRDILHRTMSGEVTPRVPASYLQTHNAVTILADEAASMGRPSN